MSDDASLNNDRKMTSVFERFLSLWVILCIIAGILLGKIAPGVAQYLDGLAIYVKGAPVVSIPIAVCLFFMMYPIMVKIDFSEVIKAGKSGKPVFLTLFVNWAIKPFTMYGIAIFFLGTLFYHFIGPPWIWSKCHSASTFRWVPPTAPAPWSWLTALKCWKCRYGAAIWQDAFCWASRPARPWYWSGAICHGAMTA